MMVDLILFAAVFGAFLGGFHCGKKFGSMRAMVQRMKAALAERFDDEPRHGTSPEDK